MGEAQENLRGQHDCAEAPTLTGAQKHSTEGHVDHKLHLKNQGVVRCPWINRCHNQRQRNGANMPRRCREVGKLHIKSLQYDKYISKIKRILIVFYT